MDAKDRAATYAQLSRAFAFPGPELQDEYIALFGHVMRDLPPYETQYGSAHVYQQAVELADICAFYRAFGLSVASGERPDHIAVELQFMSYLALREACAVRDGLQEGLEVLREGQRKFLADHLGRWGPLLGRMVAARSQNSFYKAAGELLDRFVTEDCARLGASASAYREIDVQRPDHEPEGGCFSCGLYDQCFPGAQEDVP